MLQQNNITGYRRYKPMHKTHDWNQKTNCTIRNYGVTHFYFHLLCTVPVWIQNICLSEIWHDLLFYNLCLCKTRVMTFYHTFHDPSSFTIQLHVKSRSWNTQKCRSFWKLWRQHPTLFSFNFPRIKFFVWMKFENFTANIKNVCVTLSKKRLCIFWRHIWPPIAALKQPWRWRL